MLLSRRTASFQLAGWTYTGDGLVAVYCFFAPRYYPPFHLLSSRSGNVQCLDARNLFRTDWHMQPRNACPMLVLNRHDQIRRFYGAHHRAPLARTEIATESVWGSKPTGLAHMVVSIV